MKKLIYNVYYNINDDQFLFLAKEMEKLEIWLDNYLSPLGWKMTQSVKDNDYLIVDFTIHESDFYGNIGFKFNDCPGEPTFLFYLGKDFDENKTRFGINEELVNDKTLDFIAENMKTLTDKALKMYDNWNKETIRLSGESNDIM